MIVKYHDTIIKMMMFLCAFACINGIPLQSRGGDFTDSVFSTWDIFEVDKLASIWLIKRFVNSDAEIKIYPKGEKIDEGIPFDVPDASFRRYYNASTYAVLLKHYGIQDSRCRYILKIVHDIEINTWESKQMPESLAVNNAILEIISKSKSSEEIINSSMLFFDKLYRGDALVND